MNHPSLTIRRTASIGQPGIVTMLFLRRLNVADKVNRKRTFWLARRLLKILTRTGNR